MPYIRQLDRETIKAGHVPETAGELNYLFTEIIKNYMGPNENYQRYNDVLGALEGCKLEVYRRKIAPYEDIKIKENGDVW
jgi:hypothetical protein